MQRVRHHVNLSLVPFDQLAVEPDIFGGLCHCHYFLALSPDLQCGRLRQLGRRDLNLHDVDQLRQLRSQ